MADDLVDSVGGGDDTFSDVGLEGLVELVTIDHGQVPMWRRQAAAYRELVKLAEEHGSGMDSHVENALDAWASKSSKVLSSESTLMKDSFRRSVQSAEGTALALDRIADAVEAAKKDVDRVHGEWKDLETQFQKNPHIFDGYAVDGKPGYQAAKESYAAQMRTHMTSMAVDAKQAWYTSMNKPGEYTGPEYGKKPRTPVTPITVPGSSGPGPGGTPGPGSSPYIPTPSTHTPTPTPTPSPAPGPVTEFPTPTLPGTTPPVVTGPGPIGGPPVGGAPPGIFTPGVPGMSGPPGLGGGFNPKGAGPFGAPGQRGFAPSGRSVPSVYGQRPGSGQAGAGSRLGSGGGKPGAVRPERGVIRNPNAVSGKKGKAREEEREELLNREGPETDELFEGIAMDGVTDIVRPEKNARIRRRDAGPAIGRH